jgi:nonsense-mediated mRNA decay protein 3
MTGERGQAEGSTLVRVKNNVCKRCSRQLGNYYEATMQIRSGDKELPDALRDEIVRRIRDSVELQAKTNRQLFITKVQQVPGGVDIMLSSISLARSLTKDLVESYGAESKESASLVGQSSDGIDIYRLTYLVRFPAYHVGDVMEYKGKPYKLIGLNKSGGKLMSLTDFRETSVRKSEIQDMRILVKNSDKKEALVISRSGREIQVMHPTNYSTVDLRIPEDAEVTEGGNVDVVQIEEELYYLP